MEHYLQHPRSPWSSPPPATTSSALCSSASIRPTSRCLMPRVLSGGGPERSARSDRADGRRRVGSVERGVAPHLLILRRAGKGADKR